MNPASTLDAAAPPGGAHPARLDPANPDPASTHPANATTLETDDGLRLTVRSWRAERPVGAVVLVHGFAATSLDGAVVRQAEAFRAAGLDVVSYDSRGHGSSDGLCTLGDAESMDVAAAVAYAQGRGLPVVVVGASMGAIAVLRYAAWHSTGRTGDAGPGPVAGIVAVSCPSAWRAPRTARGMFATALTQTWLGRHLALRHLRVRLAPGWTGAEPPCDLVRKINLPVALVHGEQDRFISPRDALELHRRCPEPRRLDVVPGMGHAYCAGGVHALTSAVQWVLATAARSSEAER
jgi:alpha-beta hydrolase superfamily lysophospholipase